MGSALEPALGYLQQSRVGLMDQSSRLERVVTPLASEMPARYLTKAVINERDQAIRGSLLSTFQRGQENGDISRDVRLKGLFGFIFHYRI
jgi:hypothetical protein